MNNNKYHNNDFWLKKLDCIGLLLFSSGIMYLYGNNQLVILGVLLALLFIKMHGKTIIKLKKPFLPLPPEIKLYIMWVLWSGITGYIISINIEYFKEAYIVLIQMLIMVILVYGVMISSKHSYIYVYFGIIIGGLIQIIITMTGSLDLINQISTTRILGQTTNPNSLGLFMLLTVFSALIFWQTNNKYYIVNKLSIIILIFISTLILISSGSRKSALSLLFLLFSWSIYASKVKNDFKNIFYRVSITILLLFLMYAIYHNFFNNTYLGYRFYDFFNQGGGNLKVSAQKNIRYWMYIEGLKIFLDHPIFGVGINNFGQYFYTGQYSHSNLIEPLATTGIIGFCLYQSFYFIIISRALKLIKIIKNEYIVYQLKMIILGILVIIFHGLGSPQYLIQSIFLVLTTFSVYTWNLKININDYNNENNNFS